MMKDVNCILIDMPITIYAYTVSNADGTYTIVLNSRLSKECNLASYQHELEHIENMDYEKSADVGILELHAHGN